MIDGYLSERKTRTICVVLVYVEREYTLFFELTTESSSGRGFSNFSSIHWNSQAINAPSKKYPPWLLCSTWSLCATRIQNTPSGTIHLQICTRRSSGTNLLSSLNSSLLSLSFRSNYTLSCDILMSMQICLQMRRACLLVFLLILNFNRLGFSRSLYHVGKGNLGLGATRIWGLQFSFLQFRVLWGN